MQWTAPFQRHQDGHATTASDELSLILLATTRLLGEVLGLTGLHPIPAIGLCFVASAQPFSN